MVTAQLAVRRSNNNNITNNNNRHKINNKKQSGTMRSSSSSTSAQVKCRRSGVGVASASSLSLGLWLLPVLLVLLAWQQQPCEGRYLPTRSHGDELDKLRELMLQILESSNEEQRPPNEANGNTLAQRASWLNKLNGMDGLETSRKYGSRGTYDNGRYY
ncbi:uncharacterized protein LOC128863948 [Anastrepha ludens]|uniref:uncharacterized protein LOC128863948 n=1 Tax=Anastrepha ludens TaxID=28586 RepID=UPI0023AF54BB|nr:uncharacterized protein LOC128863948 [Anastrepha ludens]